MVMGMFTNNGISGSPAVSQANQGFGTGSYNQFEQNGKQQLLGQQLAGQEQQAQTAANAAMYPASLQQSRFNTVFPWLQGQVAGLQGAISGASRPGGGVAGFGAGGPTIKTGGVYNPQNLQSQVNASNANIDRSIATQNQQSMQQMGGRGFGSNSPLLAALQGQNNAAGLGARTQAEQQLRTTAAQQNAGQQLQSQQAAAGVYGQRQQEALQARQQNIGAYSSLLSALSGLV